MIASNLVVNGASRFLNKIYCTDLSVSGSTTFATVTATGLTVNGDATITGHTSLGGYVNTTSKLSVNGVISNEWYRSAGNVGWYSQSYGGGIWMKDTSYIRTYGSKHFFVEGANLYVGSTNYYFSSAGVIQAANVNSPAATIDRLFVPGELRALQYNIQSINNLGGSFLIGPTINVPAGNNVNITAISGTTITATITGSFSTSTFPTVIWAANSKIKISGKIGGISIGTCDGKLTAAITSSSIQVQFTYGGQGTKALTVANSQASVDLDIMIYTVGTDKPIGIYMTSWGDTSWADSTAHNKSSISIYGGTSSSDVAPTVSTPVVRIGNLSGLPAVNGTNPTGWGIYTQHGYFSGMIVSSAGKIGNFNLSDKLYTGSHSTWNHASNGMYIASDGIAGGNGGTWYLWNDGTGKIGKYTFASNGALTTGSGANQAGMGNDTYAFWAGSDTPNSAPFRVTYTGALTSTSGTIGKYNITGTYLYTGTGSTQTGIGGNQAFWAGSTDSNSAPFRVAYGGALVATNATITGTITATKGTIGAANATNKITIGTNTTNASIYYGMSSLDNTTSNGFYIGTDGIALGKGVFKVTNAGALTATSATITGTIHAIDGEFGDPNGYHIGIDGDSMDIYSDAGTKKAIFGEEIIIGADSSQHISLSNSNFIITDSGASSIFEIKTSSNKEEMIGYSKTVNLKYSVNRISITSYVVDGSNIRLTFNITTISNFPQQTLTFVAKTASTQTWTQVLNNSTYTMTVKYDGKYMFEITQSGFSTSDSCRIGIIERRTVAGDVAYIIGKYNGNPGSDGIVLGRSNHFTANMSDQSTTIGIQNQIDAPYGFVIGNYNDVNYQYTTLIGSHLTPTNTDQYVFGRFNATDSGGFFIIGNGSSDSNRSNAMVISTNGDTTFSGSVTGTSFIGNASTATKLSAAQKVYVTLGTASTTTTIQGGSTSAQTIGVDGTLGIGNGGTGKTSWTQYGLVYASATNALSQVGLGISGQLLMAKGSAAPEWVYQNDINSGKTGTGGIYLYANNNNEINFGGTNTSTTIYVGYRGTDSRGIPTHFIFGGSGGSASITANDITANGNLAVTGTINGDTLKDVTSSTITNIITVNSTNATITAANVVKYGRIVQLRISWKNKSAISVGAGGNIGNISIGTLKEGYIPKIYSHAWSNGDDAGEAWYSINTNGVLQLGAMGTGYAHTVAAETLFNVAATYIV